MKKLIIITLTLLLCGCASEYTPEITEIVSSSEAGSYSSRPMEVTFTLPPEIPAQTCSPSEPHERSNIAVIKSYCNYAAGYQHYGTYIDMSGCEYAFDFSDKEIESDSEFIEALEELDALHDKAPVNTYDDIDTILNMTEYADKIDPDAPMDSKNIGCDMGQDTLFVLRSDFTLAEIYSDGDWESVNTDDYAKIIYDSFVTLR